MNKFSFSKFRADIKLKKIFNAEEMPQRNIKEAEQQIGKTESKREKKMI